MVRKRLIAVLTMNNGVLFRTRNFIPDYRYTFNFVDAWSVDEVVLLDITRLGEGTRQNFFKVVSLFAKNCFVPLTVGGGVRSIDDFKILLSIGADKVVINTQALLKPTFITEAAKLFGSQCVVVSLDTKHNGGEDYEVLSHFGTRPTGLTAQEWAKMDGTLQGYDNRLNKMVSDAVDIPVLVCSGAGNWKNFLDGFKEGGASGVCTTNIYHFTESSIKSAKQYLIRAGIDMRN
jgi:cyclase